MLSALEWTSSPQTAALVQVVARASGTQPDSDPASAKVLSPRHAFLVFLEHAIVSADILCRNCRFSFERVPVTTRVSRIYLSKMVDAVFVLTTP